MRALYGTCSQSLYAAGPIRSGQCWWLGVDLVWYWGVFLALLQIPGGHLRPLRSLPPRLRSAPKVTLMYRPQQELFRNQDLLLTLENRKNCISPFCQASPPHLQPSMEVNHRPSQYPAIVPPRPGKDIVNSPNSSKTIKMVATYLVPSTLDLSPTCITPLDAARSDMD